MRREPRSSALSPVRGIAAMVALGAILGATALNGCGSRGPLDDTPLADAAVEAAESPDASDAAPSADAGREAGTGIVACGGCLLTTCGPAIFECIQAPACRTAFQCVATTCLGSGGAGGLNPLCLVKCAGADPSGGLGVLNVFTCITGKCGADCATLVGDLGGGLGGGIGGRPRDGGRP